MEKYNIENRGLWPFHWLFLVVSSLRFLEKENSKPKIFFKDFEYKNKDKDTEYCFEILEYFKNDFEFVDDKTGGIEFHGEPLIDSEHIEDKGYIYLRNKVLSQYINKKKFLNKYIYIKRNNQYNLSFNLNINNNTKRHILNEDEVVSLLTNKYNFLCINLEDYSFDDKVDIFHNSSIIISIVGSALTFAAFASDTTKIIEINPHELGINQFKYSMVDGGDR
jgi:hypothetical protein